MQPIESPVGHISLDFHPKDAPKMTNERMADIACDYMNRMGSETLPISPQSESSDFRMSHVSMSNAPNDEVCIDHGEPVSDDFK